MAKIISLDDGRRADDNLICRTPLEFRRGDWHKGQVLQCLRREAKKYQAHRRQALVKGHRHLRFVPEHFSLVGGCDYTIMGLYRLREQAERAKELYRLAGLMECVVNSTSPLLRTDLLHSLYKSILDLRRRLNCSWKGDSKEFLLPLHPHLYQRSHFFGRVRKANTLKALYETVEKETEHQFDLLSAEYVFYLPQSSLDKRV
jgi:hypothetical protein